MSRGSMPLASSSGDAAGRNFLKMLENELHLQAKNRRFQAIFMIIARPSQDKQNNPDKMQPHQ